MAQMTRDMAERIVVNWQETGKHYGLTAWEECQLACFWLAHHEFDIPVVATDSGRSFATRD